VEAAVSVPSSAVESLGQAPLFSHLPANSLARLANQSWVRRYPAGQVLMSEGDPGESLLVLETGQVKVSRFTSSGQEVVLAAVEAPQSIGELALLDGARRSATITAQTPVQVRIVPRAAFLDLLRTEPAAMMAVLTAMATMVRATNDRLADVVALDVPGRVAKWLLTRAAARGERRAQGIAVSFELSQRELASELGTTRVSVNKALKTFEALGALSQGDNELILLKPDLLLEYTY
jgi:CRP/FNR family transcriptional regulator